MKRNLLGFLALLLFPLSLISQDFNFEIIPNATHPDFNRLVWQNDDLAYLTFLDGNYNEFLYSYDGENLNSIALPDNLFFRGIYFEEDEKIYMELIDGNFVSTLAIYESGAFELFPNGDQIGDYLFKFGGSHYFSFFDNVSFNTNIKSFGGTVFENIPSPDNLDFQEYIGRFGNADYMTFGDGNDIFLYSYEAGIYTFIDSRNDVNLTIVELRLDDKSFVSVYDYYFNQTLYEVSPTGFNIISAPLGFTTNNGGVINFQGENYFAWSDVFFDNSTLFRLEDNSDWTMIPNPPNLTVRFLESELNTEDKLYLAYNDPDFDRQLVIFNGTNLQVPEPPSSVDYTNYLTKFKQGVLLDYYDFSIYASRLYFYDNNSIFEVPNQPGNQFGNYEGAAFNRVFLSFINSNFESTLYTLKANTLPTSEDASITIPKETPYQFSPDNFVFSDVDAPDMLQGIQIANLPTSGILHFDGAQVNINDIIDVADLGKLNYVPLDDGVGSPYDSFEFRVWDGSGFSEITYTMLINIVESTGVDDLAEKIKIDIYPNPASEWITVLLDESILNENPKLNIVNTSGRIVHQITPGQVESTISIRDLPSGNYYLMAQSSNSYALRKFVVVK